MTQITQTRESLTREVWIKGGKKYQLEDVENVINNFLKEISATLLRGERIEMRGFGVFQVKFVKPHMGRDPRIGHNKPIQLPGRFAVKFTAGKALKELLNARK